MTYLHAILTKPSIQATALDQLVVAAIYCLVIILAYAFVMGVALLWSSIRNKKK